MFGWLDKHTSAMNAMHTASGIQTLLFVGGVR